MSLTPKQELFVANYCKNGFNATQAARSAGYSEKTAKQMGTENLAKPSIREAIDSYKKKVSDKVLCDTEWVVKGLMKEAAGGTDDTTASARVSAYKALSEFTGGFDSNIQKHDVSGMTDIASRLQSAKAATKH